MEHVPWPNTATVIQAAVGGEYQLEVCTSGSSKVNILTISETQREVY